MDEYIKVPIGLIIGNLSLIEIVLYLKFKLLAMRNERPTLASIADGLGYTRNYVLKALKCLKRRKLILYLPKERYWAVMDHGDFLSTSELSRTRTGKKGAVDETYDTSLERLN